MARTVIKLANSIINIVVGFALFLAGAYAVYCLWDNQRIYVAADNVQSELLTLKPKSDAGETGPTFDDLRAINSDVCAWITMDGTKIDYPVLQGQSNIDYINTDVYGNFALAGSIFLDYRNKSDFSDPYSVLYGHHMEKSTMFGDLDKYLNQEFFNSNDTGKLLVPGRCYILRVFACIQTKASDVRIFEPYKWTKDIRGILNYVQDEGINFSQETISTLHANLDVGGQVQILALTTCSSDFTDARTIVLATMSEEIWQEGGDAQP